MTRRRLAVPFSRMKNESGSLGDVHVCISPESVAGQTAFVAVCDDLNLAAQGSTEKDAQDAFIRVLVTYIHLKEQPSFPKREKSSVRFSGKASSECVLV